jgi:hypothetical protein
MSSLKLFLRFGEELSLIFLAAETGMDGVGFAAMALAELLACFF